MIKTNLNRLADSLENLYSSHKNLYTILHLGLSNQSYVKPPLSSLTPFLHQLEGLKVELNKREPGSKTILLYLKNIEGKGFVSNYCLYTAPMAITRKEYDLIDIGMCNSKDKSSYDETLCSAKFYIMSLREVLYFIKNNETLVECIELNRING